MTKLQIKARFKEMGLSIDSISFYSNKSGDSDDVSFGDCEISGIEGNLVDCTALGDNGKVYEFQALESLVSGNLGRLAGAF